jgi:hypothetical protein
MIAALVVLAALAAAEPEKPTADKPVAIERAIAKPGEWITRPDGSRVCRIALGLYRAMPSNPKIWCVDWQEPEPFNGQLCDSVPWCRTYLGGMQFLIEGTWRP